MSLIFVSFKDGVINDQLLNLYGRKIPDDNELIDISSDDSSEMPSKPPQNNSNGDTLIPCPPRLVNAKSEIVNINKTEELPIERTKKRKAEQNNTSSSSKRTKKEIAGVKESAVTFKNVGGMDKVLQEICKLLIHIHHPEIYRQLGISPPRGFLLHGPPGCGKTLLANAISGVS